METDSAKIPWWQNIWLFAFGYFAAYVPYSALTKVLSSGLLEGMSRPLTGAELLPAATFASSLVTVGFLWSSGWWRQATQWHSTFGDWPHPSLWTFLSGACCAAILTTTTLAYSFTGVSIVFVMLLMRGGVLIIAPIVDALTGRKTRWFSWAGLLLSLGALVVAFLERSGYLLTTACLVDIAVYLLAYFLRLRIMSRLAKSSDVNANARYFVEEQLVASPLSLLAVGILALVSDSKVAQELQFGFTGFWSLKEAWLGLLVGVLSAGTGIFGGLILLDKRENTYCVPINRSSSILAGVVAAWVLAVGLGQKMPGRGELLGAGLIIGAIGFLTIPPLLEKRRR